ncbi:MAG: hypothetical protein GC192_08485 [Bacteroidetes bacterium]|nr:hypothetical protein [Bacteroidota bacterium]
MDKKENFAFSFSYFFFEAQKYAIHLILQHPKQKVFEKKVQLAEILVKKTGLEVPARFYTLCLIAYASA